MYTVCPLVFEFSIRYSLDLTFLKICRRKGQGSQRVKIGPVSKIDEIWLYCVCMSSVTENVFLKVWHLI